MRGDASVQTRDIIIIGVKAMSCFRDLGKWCQLDRDIRSEKHWIRWGNGQCFRRLVVMIINSFPSIHFCNLMSPPPRHHVPYIHVQVACPHIADIMSCIPNLMSPHVGPIPLPAHPGPTFSYSCCRIYYLISQQFLVQVFEFWVTTCLFVFLWLFLSFVIHFVKWWQEWHM